jgi:hypothetical protein
MSEPKYHPKEVAALLRESDAKNAKLQAENKLLREALIVITNVTASALYARR